MKWNQICIKLASALMMVGSLALDAAVEKLDKIAVADQLLAQNQKITEKYTFAFREMQFVGYPEVYSPIIFPGASKQTDLVIQPGERFLELGCGTGVFSVLAALRGADEVVAIDINPHAVANTAENAVRHGVIEKVTVLQGDMFQPLGAGQRFDIIFFNIPFCHRSPGVDGLTMLEKSLYDPEHDLLHRFFKEGKEHLAPNGRMILGYSTTHGDIAQMYEWASTYGWKVKLLHKLGDENSDFITVEMYEFRPA